MIHEEWIRAVLKNRPDLVDAQLEHVRTLMDTHVRDCLVVDFENLIEGLNLPDPDDRHVLAAAIRGRADVIVTYNLKDFPNDYLEAYGMEAQHPDTFITHLFDLNSGAVVATAQEHRASLTRPRVSVETYLKTLERNGLIRTVTMLSPFSSVL